MPTEIRDVTRDDDRRGAGTGGLDAAALAAIRDLMETEAIAARHPAARASIDRARAVSQSHTAPVRRAAPPQAAPVRAEALPVEEPAAPRAPGIFARAGARLRSFRPSRRQVVLAALALLIFLRPWLVVSLVLVTVFALLGLLLIFGYDGLWRRAMGIMRWYAGRRPARAAEMHRKLDSFAMGWDAVLDRFPEGTVDALYLPDFAELAEADRRHDEALERRLSNLREGGV